VVAFGAKSIILEVYIKNPHFMTRAEYELIYDAFKSHRYKMTDAQEVLSEKILDDLFYPEFDKLSKEVA